MKASLRLALWLTLGTLALVPTSACTGGGLENSSPLPGATNAGAPAGIGSNTGQSGGAGAPLSNAGASNGSAGAGAQSSNAGASSGNAGSAGSAQANCPDKPPNNGETCEHAVEYGWCAMDWLGDSCQKTCKHCPVETGSGGANGSAGATQGHGGGENQPPPLADGKDGWATRYWDCCKPACGWKGNVPGGSQPLQSCNLADQSLGTDYAQASACNNGGAFMCHNFQPWAVSSTLAYGFAAVNKGSDFCGKCYQLQFTGKSHNSKVDAGSASLSGKTMIVQAINNGGVDGNQFDLLIPGGGVGDFNACSKQWGTSDLGEQYGGFFLACQKQNGFDYEKSKACTVSKCQSVFADKPDLIESCAWFTGWFGAPDNPALTYKEVTCPAAISSASGLKL